MRPLDERMPMLQYFQGGILEGGVERVARLYWEDVTWGHAGKTWYVKAGEKMIFAGHTKEAVEAFLYGFGLVCALLPEDIFDHLVLLVKAWTEPEDITPEERARFGGNSKI